MTNPTPPKTWQKRWNIFKKEELSVHSMLWFRSKKETIDLFEEFLQQEIDQAKRETVDICIEEFKGKYIDIPVGSSNYLIIKESLLRNSILSKLK